MENQQLALETWNAFLRGDVKAAFADLADDVTWTIPGAIPGISGVKRGKASILEFLRGVARAFPKGLRSEVRHVHATDSAVVVEMTNRSETADGKPYENEYCFVFEIAGGKIRAIREYVDTQRAAAVFGA